MKINKQFVRIGLSVAILFSQISCGTLSSRIIYDSKEAVSRLKQGGDLESEVDRLALPLIEDRHFSGLAVGVFTPEKGPQTFMYGESGLPANEGQLTGDTFLQIGSVSKLFIIALYTILIEQGVLNQDDTIREILPLNVPVSKSLGEITLFELAANTSGLPRESKGFSQFKDLFDYVFKGENIYSYLDEDYLYEYLRKGRINKAKKGVYHYSNMGFALLAHLIEIKTNTDYAELVEENIFKPLKMEHTLFSLSEEQQKHLAVGHPGSRQPLFMRKKSVVKPWDMGRVMNPAGGLYSTVNDLLIFLQANLGVLNHPLERTFQKTQKIEVSTPVEDVAMAWLINYFDDGKITLYYKHGMVAGYSAYVGFNRDEKIAVVVLGTNFEWDDAVGHNLLLRLTRSNLA